MNPSLTYLTLNDFKPGIIQRLGQSRSGFGPAPLGAAAANGTYRCYALLGGGLAPLPRRTFSFTPDDGEVLPLFGGHNPIFNTGLKVVPSYTIFNPTANSAEFFIRDIRDVSDPTGSVTIYMGHEWDAGTTQEINMVRYFQTGLGGFQGLELGTISGAVTDRLSPVYFTTSFLANTMTTVNRTRVVVGGVTKVQGQGEGLAGPATLTIADPDPDTVNSTYVFGKRGIPVAHQGRIVFLLREANTIDSDEGLFLQANDAMVWTKVGEVNTDTLNPIATSVQYFPELPYGLGAWASVSASDLLVIKHQGGAVLLQGDLNNPLIRRLPSVPSTNGSECVGIMTAQGFAYGVNRDGVYLWRGGDGADLLSPTLDQDFWMPTGTSIFQNFQGQFSTIGNWLLAPNNWVFDFTTQSWWRLEDSDTLVFHLFDVDPTNAYIYAAPLSFTPDTFPQIGTESPALYGFRQDQGATSYKWTSQPIFISDTKEVTVDEIILTVQGSGTVTITVNGDACTFDNIASPTTPVRIRLSFGKRFDIMQIVIDSTETTGGVIGAPVVYDVKFGIREKITLPVAYQ